ncbi:MAG: hypothetical protein AB1671_09335 [Thermodesulfobacteriota bacterium]|jgi:hypothetical protein
MARARDNRGHVQPLEPSWNPDGYLCNVVDQVCLTAVTSGRGANKVQAAMTETPLTVSPSTTAVTVDFDQETGQSTQVSSSFARSPRTGREAVRAEW